MFIDFSPPLPEDDAELLELELGTIADELGIEDVDIALASEDGADVFEMLMLYYENERKDDSLLWKHGQEILREFERRTSERKPLTPDFAPVLARVGKIQLKLVRE